MKIKDKLFGGEYDFFPKKKNHKIESLFPSRGSFTFNGRSAFYLIIKKIKEKKIRSIYVPYLICESLIEVLKKEKININYYDIDKNFNEKLSKIDKNCALLKIHYFGLRKSKSLNTLFKSKKLVIIEDFSHYIPSKKILEGNRSFKFMSLRKLGLSPIGGWTNVNEKKRIRKLNKFKEFIDLKIKKTRYLNKELTNRNLKIEISYLRKFQQFEKLFSNNYKMGTISKEKMGQLITKNIYKIKKIRKKNWVAANKILNNFSLKIFEVKNFNTFFSYLVFTKKRDDIINSLRRNDIYCPIFWKIKNKLPNNSFSKFCSEKMISLPIDQRYSIKKIRYISNILKNCLQY